jgi:hypothetical protein
MNPIPGGGEVNREKENGGLPSFPEGCRGEGALSGEDYISLCALKRTLLTPREEKVLARIRECRAKAGELKAGIARMRAEGPPESESLALALEELEVLRRWRAELEEERIAAADERMRLLGHL